MLLYGHRGAMGESPENSLKGFAYLRSLGIHHVELDVRLAADGLVVVHDASVNRTTSTTGLVKELTIRELAKIGVPSLRKVITEWKPLKSIQLEVKTDRCRPDETIGHYQQFATELNKIIKEFKLHKKSIISSKSEAFLAISIGLMPKIAHGIVVGESRVTKSEDSVNDLIKQAKNLHCEYFIPYYKLISTEAVNKAHRAGMKMIAWTVNTKKAAIELKKMSVDGIITDYPSRLIGVV